MPRTRWGPKRSSAPWTPCATSTPSPAAPAPGGPSRWPPRPCGTPPTAPTSSSGCGASSASRSEIIDGEREARLRPARRHLRAAGGERRVLRRRRRQHAGLPLPRPPAGAGLELSPGLAAAERRVPRQRPAHARGDPAPCATTCATSSAAIGPQLLGSGEMLVGHRGHGAQPGQDRPPPARVPDHARPRIRARAAAAGRGRERCSRAGR